jgi:general secretion pathway protein L
MARYLGIDITPTSVHAILLRTSYRRLAIEGMAQCEIQGDISQAEAIRRATHNLHHRVDGISVELSGERVFWRRLQLPLTAAKQLTEVIPFEIEAQIPFDMEDAVFDYREQQRDKNAESIPILATIAKVEDVRERIALVSNVIKVEPDKVVPGNFVLANLVGLVPELDVPGPIAIIELGISHSEMLVMTNGEPIFARTLSVGTQGLPESASVLARQMRQTLAAFRSSGGAEVQVIYLVGKGAQLRGADVYLGGELGIFVAPMPLPNLDGMLPQQAEQMPHFAKALGLAMSLLNRGKSFDLRQGPLTFERGFGFLREKIPVLAGLASVIVVSFVFSSWAEMRALKNEHNELEEALAMVSKDVLGQETRDPEQAIQLLTNGPGNQDPDPLPDVDAFDVLAQLAEKIPDDMKHDLESLEVQKSGATGKMRVSLNGIVDAVKDSETLSAKLKEYPCFKDLKIIKTSQEIGGSRQKYQMEFELRCSDPVKKKNPKDKTAAASTNKGSKP